VAEAFALPEGPDLLPRFNIAPGQPVAVVRQKARAEGRELALLRWGLVPAWADDPSVGHRLANARSATAPCVTRIGNLSREHKPLLFFLLPC
jgi:putative SOS response-associated peptidase YedK